MLLNLAVSKGFHQPPVQVANLKIFLCHGVKYTVIGFDYRFLPRQRRIPGTVTELIHYLDKLLDFLFMRRQARVLAAYLKRDHRIKGKQELILSVIERPV